MSGLVSTVARVDSITEWLEMEGTLKGHLVHLPCTEQGRLQCHQVLRAPSSLTLSVSRDRASITSLGNLCQCFHHCSGFSWCHPSYVIQKNYF